MSPNACTQSPSVELPKLETRRDASRFGAKGQFGFPISAIRNAHHETWRRKDVAAADLRRGPPAAYRQVHCLALAPELGKQRADRRRAHGLRDVMRDACRRQCDVVHARE